MARSIFVSMDGDVQGPFTAAELSRLWRAGELAGASYWTAGAAGWAPVEKYSTPAPLTGDAVAVSTTDEIPGRPIHARVGVVAAEAAVALDLIDEALASLRDVAGGRAGTLARQVEAARTQCLALLQQRAAELDADGVVGLRLAFTELTAKGRGAMLVCAYGTAVALAPPAPPAAA